MPEGRGGGEGGGGGGGGTGGDDMQCFGNEESNE